jgi:hypothetical protein
VALVLFIAAAIMWLLHVQGAQKVFDVGALVVFATVIAWFILRGHYEHNVEFGQSSDQDNGSQPDERDSR